MQSQKFSVTVVERKPMFIAGLHITTSIDRASKDCPKIWEDFATYMPGLMSMPGRNGLDEASYGVSFMLDEIMFDYWAAVEIKNATLPPEMPTLYTAEVPGGLYAECQITGLELLPQAFDYLYKEWMPSQSEYTPLYSAPCYELYKSDFMATQSLILYSPLSKK